MKLRTIGRAAVAAMALVAGRAQAQAAAAEDAGWDTKGAVLFTLPNLFQNGSSTVIDDYSGMIGGQWNLSNTAGIRAGLSFSRIAAGTTETTNAAGQTAKTVPTWTSQYFLGLEAQYLMRLATTAVSPYFGGGLELGFTQRNRKGDDVTFAGATTGHDDFSRSWDFGVIGTGGLEWRIHKTVSLFAEYRLTITAYESTRSQTKTTITGVTSTTKSHESHFFDVSTSLAHTGQIGILAFF